MGPWQVASSPGRGVVTAGLVLGPGECRLWPQWARLKASRPEHLAGAPLGLTGSAGYPGLPRGPAAGSPGRGGAPAATGPRHRRRAAVSRRERAAHLPWDAGRSPAPWPLSRMAFLDPRTPAPRPSPSRRRAMCWLSATRSVGRPRGGGLGSPCRPSACRAAPGGPRVSSDPPSSGRRRWDAPDPGPEPQEERRGEARGGQGSRWEPTARAAQLAACRRPQVGVGLPPDTLPCPGGVGTGSWAHML